MTRKIFGGIIMVSVVTLLLSFVLNIGVMYGYFDKQIQKELKSEALYIEAAIEDKDISNEDYLEHVQEVENRITWIDTNGTVLYDNKSDASKMDNHKEREEVKEALKDGEGNANRESDTISKRTIYYAKQMEDGTVLRVASEQSSIVALLAGMIRPGVVIFILAVVLSALLAHRVSRMIIRPINAMDLNNPDEVEIYEELNPFLHKISKQNKVIQAQMENLKQKQKEFTIITENMQEGFLLIDKNTEVLSYNSSALRLLGIEQPGENQTVLALNRSATFRKAVEQAIAGKHNEQVMKTDSACYYIYANPVMSGGKVSGVVVVILDATEKEMRNQLRREFTSNVSHELKTPLTSIYGVADMLAAGMVKPEHVPAFAGDIFKECKRMLHLIDDIIRLSQLDEQSIQQEKEPLDLYDLSKSVKKSLTMAAEEKKISLQVEGEHVLVSGVPTMVEEIIYNLCENAIKYNKENGSVTVRISKELAEATLTVTDTGIGIPAEDINRVFERFYRVDKSHSRKIGGTGLGLSIVKHAVQYHDGTIQITSVEGEGTTVTVTMKAI